jgi:cytochrome c oxidase assembly protein subunit 15
MTQNLAITAPPRWLHRLAWLTVCATMLLLVLGAGVTSFDVGMVDPEGYQHPWVIVQVLLQNNGFSWLLEYGHRAMGMIVGLLAIGLAIGFGMTTAGRTRWLGLLALTLVIAQGMLGKYRVDLNALYGRTYAMVHGCFAQIVFAVLVCLVVVTSRRWQRSYPEHSVSPQLKRWSLLAMFAVYGQLVLGGLVRHKESLLGPRGHLLGAFLVVIVVAWLAKLILESECRDRMMGTLMGLAVLVGIQLLLGIESWLAKFFVPDLRSEAIAPIPLHSQWVRTAHYVVGTLIFAHVVILALKANLQPSLIQSEDAEAVPPLNRTLEGVA